MKHSKKSNYARGKHKKVSKKLTKFTQVQRGGIRM